MPRIGLLVGVALALLAGCDMLPSLPGLVRDEPTAQVASHPFTGEPVRTQRTKVSYAPAAEEVAYRVDRVGRDLLAANGQAGLGRPLFASIGAPAPEIFHIGTSAVYLTEGLVKQCPTDRELSAVLASELGKMVAEREASTSKDVRDPEVPPPVDLPIGGHGYAGDADPSRAAELARYAEAHPRKRRTARPDPNRIARALFKQAGQLESDLDAVQPLLQAAEKNGAMEQQFKGAPQPGAGGWSP